MRSCEIEALDLQFNVSKSVVMRVGPRWNASCAVCSWISYVEFCDSIKYLGMYLKAGTKFSCTYDHLKLYSVHGSLIT